MLYSGLTGAVKNGDGASAKLIKHLNGFDLTVEQSLTEDNSFGTGWSESVPGIKKWSFTFDGTADFETDSEQEALYSSLEEGKSITVGFYLNETTYFQGKAFVKDVKIKHVADGKADISFSGTGSGELSKTIGTATATTSTTN